MGPCLQVHEPVRAEVGVISGEQRAVQKQTFLLCRLGPCQALLTAADCKAEGEEGNLSLCLLPLGILAASYSFEGLPSNVFLFSSTAVAVTIGCGFQIPLHPQLRRTSFTAPFQNYPTSQSVPPPQRTASTGQGPSSELLSPDNSNSHLCSYSCRLQLPLASFPFAFSVLQYPFGQFLHENAWCGF